MKNFWNEEVMQIPVCQELVKNWEIIKEEALFFLSNQNPNTKNGKSTTLLTSRFIKIPEVKDNKITDNLIYLSDKGNWEVAYIASNKIRQNAGEFNDLNKFYQKITVRNTGRTIEENADYAIECFKTFNKIVNEMCPDKVSACSISLVSPGTYISPHFGSSGFLRCHLCLVNDDQCIITVGHETKKWEEGKILAFKDGGPYPHSVVHSGTKDRIVIIFDIDFDYAREYINSPYL